LSVYTGNRTFDVVNDKSVTVVALLLRDYGIIYLKISVIPAQAGIHLNVCYGLATLKLMFVCFQRKSNIRSIQ